MRIYVNVKQLSKGGRRIKPVPFDYTGSFSTVKEFLTATVNIMYDSFMKKPTEEENFGKVLSEEEISNMAEMGKVAFGIVYGEKETTREKAVETALQAYKDGLVRLFIGSEEAGEPESRINLKENDEVTFIRLAMLAGRMW